MPSRARTFSLKRPRSSFSTTGQMARAGWSSSMSASTSTVRKKICWRSMNLKRGGAAGAAGDWSGRGAGAAVKGHSSGRCARAAVKAHSSNRQRVSAGIVAPPAFEWELGGAFQHEGIAILDDPLDGLAFFQFEGLGQRGRADEIELAGAIGALDELNFGEGAHKQMIQLAI